LTTASVVDDLPTQGIARFDSFGTSLAIQGASEHTGRDAYRRCAYLRGQTDAHRILAVAQERQRIQPQPITVPPPAPRKPSRLEWLRDALADPSQRERARAALRMEDWLFDRVTGGLVTLSGVHGHKLREALA
jgi:hypothetical protein